MKNNNSIIKIYFFVISLFLLTLAAAQGWSKGFNIPLSIIPVFAGLLAFFFWIFVYKKRVVEIYSKGYPYRKLKSWGWILSFVFFQYIIAWGLYSGQLSLIDEHLYAIIVILAGAIAFYFSFVRMKVSLRYFFLGVFIPILAAGCALGFGKYFGFVNFFTPKQDIIKIVFLNTTYWIIFSILYQLICEEVAFRGFLTQQLLSKSRTHAVLISSLIFAMWHLTIDIFQNITIAQGIIDFIEKFIIGCLLALLFIKGKNLLISAISYGIITGLKISILSSSEYPGLGQYFQITGATSELKFIMLWLSCLLIGTVLVLITPQKRKSMVIERLDYARHIKSKQIS